MGFLFILSNLLLIISFILKRKTEKKLDIINFLCLSIVLLYCYNTFICYVLTFFTLPCKLYVLSFINFLITILLTISIFKEKKIQKYTCNIVDILYISIIIIVILAVTYMNFGFPLDISYISGDPSIHFLTSIRFAEQETLMPNSAPDMVYGNLATMKPASYVNSGLLMKCLCKNLEPVSCYYVFAGFDILTLILIGVTLYTALKKYSQKREHTFWAFLVALICSLGYPLNSLLFGFEYLTMGLLVLIAIMDLVHYYENDILEFKYVLLMFGLLNFGLFCSYYMFVPFVYSALWMYFCIKNYYKTNRILTKELTILLALSLLIPFALGYIYHLAPNVYAILINKNISINNIWSYSSSILGNGIATDGFIYKNLYSNIILLIPLTIYFFIKEEKEKRLKNESFLGLLLLFLILFIEILLIGNALGKVSMYYLSKNYFALWILFAFINYKALLLIYHKNKWLSRLLICTYITLAIICTTFSKVDIVESTINENENMLSVMEIFGANKTLLKYKTSEYNQNEFEIIEYASKNLDFKKKIEIVADHRTYFWSYVLLRYTDNDKTFEEKIVRGQELLGKKWINLDEKIKSDKLDYVIFFNKSKKYANLKEILFKNSEIIYQNESGGILKYNK